MTFAVTKKYFVLASKASNVSTQYTSLWFHLSFIEVIEFPVTLNELKCFTMCHRNEYAPFVAYKLSFVDGVNPYLVVTY